MKVDKIEEGGYNSADDEDWKINAISETIS